MCNQLRQDSRVYITTLEFGFRGLWIMWIYEMLKFDN